jgi:hypothetical protein
MAGEESAPGIVAMVSPGGSARQVAGGLSLPNGMPVTPGAQTLIVAQLYANRLTAFEVAAGGGLSNRRLWAELGDSVPAASAPTPATPSGTPASPASVACAPAKMARCWTPSSVTAAASPARSQAQAKHAVHDRNRMG